MSTAPKLIGEVVAAPHPHIGWLVRVERYASGRKLPAPRLLVDETDPKHLRGFPTRLVALDVLHQFRTNPRSIRALRPLDSLDSPVRPAQVVARKLILPIENSAQHYEDEHAAARRKRRAKAPRALPEVSKLMKAAPERRIRKMKSTMGIETMIAAGFPVTRCIDGAQQRDSSINYKGAGILPGHLDPRELVS